MPLIQTLEPTLENTRTAKTIRYYLHRYSTRKNVEKALQRLQDAERKGSSPEPVHMPLDFRVWMERINRLWPM